MRVPSVLLILLFLLLLNGSIVYNSVSAGIYEQNDYTIRLGDSIEHPLSCRVFKLTFADVSTDGDNIRLLFKITGLYYPIPNYTLVVTVTQDKDYTDPIDIYGRNIKTEWLSQVLFMKIRKVFTSGYMSKVDVTISVNMLKLAKAMINKANNAIKDAEQKTNELGIYLPIDSYKSRLKDAEANYNAGYYCDAIQIASEIMETINNDLELSLEAYNKIRDAESALSQAKKLGHEGTNQYKSAQAEIHNAWEYYYEAKWQSAIDAAEEALSYLNELMEGYGEAQEKLREAEKLIQNLKDKYTNPRINLKDAEEYLSAAKTSLEAGKFALAKDYATKAIEKARSIEAAYIKAVNARESAREKINSAETQNPEICLKDIKSLMTLGDKALFAGKYEDAYKYYLQVLEKVNKTVELYKKVREKMEYAKTIILEYEAKGYKMIEANETYNKGLSAVKSCDYENAYTFFQNAEIQANETYNTAREVENKLNDIKNVLNKLRTMGIDINRYSPKLSEINSLYESGDYKTALQTAMSLYDAVSSEYDTAKVVYEKLRKAEQDIKYTEQKLQELLESAGFSTKVKLPEMISNKLKLAWEEFKKGNYKLAEQYSQEALQQAKSEYERQASLVNKIQEWERISRESINSAKLHLQEIKDNIFYRVFRTPEVVASVRKTKELIQKAEETLSKEAKLKSQGASLIEIAKLAENAKELAKQAEAMAMDPDQDGIPSYADKVSLLPTSYVIGGAIDLILLILGILLVRHLSRG
ncbi:coiled-coil domain-containing protein [Pyrococcus abyssi]|nr:hypothetical protein [Pyrococcus abyssi]CCE71113.1 TPA: hypothetical protein PAB1263 [Pyrococcus abyssi GE5]